MSGNGARASLALLAVVAGCSPDAPDRRGRRNPPAPAPMLAACGDEATVSVEAAADRVWLARAVRVELDAPAEAELMVDGVPVARYPAAEVHELPVYGRPGAVREVRVLLDCGDDTGELGPIEVDVGPGPEPWPEIEVFADRPDLRELGLTVLDVGQPEGRNWVAALEPDGVPVWAWASDSGKILHARIEPDGTVWVLAEEALTRLDLLGRILARWQVAGSAAPGSIPVDALGLHHEVVPIDGGFVALDNQITRVSEYPTSEALPNGPFAPADLIDPVVLVVADDGTVLERRALVERLDPQRIGWLSLQQDPGGYDWGHANAVAIHPADGGLVASVRHQDALVKLDRATGDVVWILANPDGWRPPWDALRLAPVGDLAWPYHQHGPMVTANADGTIDVAMFDNGNFDRTTPYSGVDDGEGYTSRMVVFRIDEAARTVSEVWSLDRTTTGPLFAPAFGDVDLLPITGNHLGVFGMLYSEGGERNVDRGRGGKSVRLVEATPAGEIAWELSIWDDEADAPNGWQTHGARRVPSLYPRP